MSTARRCYSCRTDWPTTLDVFPPFKPAFTTCPACIQSTVYVQDGEPLDRDEAISRRNHAEFEHFYSRRERERIDAEMAEVAIPDFPEERAA